MIVFDWRDAEDVPWYLRYTAGATPGWQFTIHGVQWWLLRGEMGWGPVDVPPWIVQGDPSNVGPRGPVPGRPDRPLPRRPLLFVSHRNRKLDIARALEAVALADRKGFDVWLDVLEPRLNGLPAAPGREDDTQAQALAGVIEVALVNATHVLVVRTKNTDGSTWVPYEYGRVRDDDTLSGVAACWLAEADTGKLPAYYHLGFVARSKPALGQWLEDEASRWPPQPGRGGNGPSGLPPGTLGF